jgi:hypothetical protein
MNYKFLIILILTVIVALKTCLKAAPQVQDDTVCIQKIIDLPLIDGMGNDMCWQKAAWQSIDMVWIPWKGSVSESDYTGKYKVVWSPVSNLLYFLVEITDDVIVDDYIPGVSADIYNFDILEVFIDENRSRGRHVFDAGDENAENAFAYHIYAPFPLPG